MSRGRQSNAMPPSESEILKKVKSLKERQKTLQKFLDEKARLRAELKETNRLIDQNVGIVRQMINQIDQADLDFEGKESE